MKKKLPQLIKHLQRNVQSYSDNSGMGSQLLNLRIMALKSMNIRHSNYAV